MTEWILFVCLINPTTQAVKCRAFVAPSEEVCEYRRAEVDVMPGIIATTPCRAYEKTSAE